MIILVSGLLFIVFEKTGITDFYQDNDKSSVVQNNPVINLSPPTEEESNAGNEQKEKIIKQEEDVAEQNSTTKNEVSLIIVDANQYDNEVEVRAFVSNIIQDGTCTYTFTKDGSDTITKSSPAFADASSTPCVTLQINQSEFQNTGIWDLEVTYTNEVNEGSANTTIEIN